LPNFSVIKESKIKIGYMYFKKRVGSREMPKEKYRVRTLKTKNLGRSGIVDVCSPVKIIFPDPEPGFWNSSSCRATYGLRVL